MSSLDDAFKIEMTFNGATGVIGSYSASEDKIQIPTVLHTNIGTYTINIFSNNEIDEERIAYASIFLQHQNTPNTVAYCNVVAVPTSEPYTISGVNGSRIKLFIETKYGYPNYELLDYDKIMFQMITRYKNSA